MARETHTPIPWRAKGRYIFAGKGSKTIAELPCGGVYHGKVDAGNAALIVRAVNERAALREALAKIRNTTDGHPVDADRRDRINAIARAALALGETPKEGAQ